MIIPQSLRRQLRRLTWLASLSLALPLTALVQASAPASGPAPLPADAQEGIKKGIIAATAQDYLLAVRYFQDARKSAPDAPEIYYNLGLAESKIPGRELRSIAWFAAYLAATPHAQNAAAVRDEIDVLDVKSQSNVSRVLRSAQGMASQTGLNDQAGPLAGDLAKGLELLRMNDYLADIAGLWAEAGDMAAAVKTSESIQDPNSMAHAKSRALEHIASGQANSGDIAGGLKTSTQIPDPYGRTMEQVSLAEAQAIAGDFAGALQIFAFAQKSADLIEHPEVRADELIALGSAEVVNGDIAGAKYAWADAKRSADLIQDGVRRGDTLIKLALRQAEIGYITGAQEALEDAGPAINTPDSARSLNPGVPGTLILRNQQENMDLVRRAIVKEQVRRGDIAGAQRTANLIQDPRAKDAAQGNIGEADEMLGTNLSIRAMDLDISNGSDKELYHASDKDSAWERILEAHHAERVQGVHPATPKVADWLTMLDDKSTYHDCALDTSPFVDLASHLTSHQAASPIEVVSALIDTAKKMIKARNLISQMVTQQTKQLAKP